MIISLYLFSDRYLQKSLSGMYRIDFKDIIHEKTVTFTLNSTHDFRLI